MRIVREHKISLEWADINGRVNHPTPDIEKREPGYHVSGILRAMALHSGILNKKYATRDPDDMPICIAMGFAWEQWAVGLYHNMIWQPGSRSVDDIHGNIDGLTILDASDEQLNGTEVQAEADDFDSVFVIEEFKCTWKSKNSHNLLGQWLWMRQAQSYCHMYGTRLCRFHVMWIAGGYKPPTPAYHTYLIEFTPEEIQQNWNQLLQNRHLAVPE